MSESPCPYCRLATSRELADFVKDPMPLHGHALWLVTMGEKACFTWGASHGSAVEASGWSSNPVRIEVRRARMHDVTKRLELQR